MKRIILATIIACMGITSCKTTKPAETAATPKPAETPKPVETPKPAMDCSAKNLTYASDIKQIIEQNCTSCHGYGGAAGYDFQSVEDVNRAAKNGDLLGTIKWEKGFKKMPAHAEKLDDATIGKIECWISNGMK